MPRTQFSDNPLVIWVVYDTAPARATAIEVANPNPNPVTVGVQRTNGQWDDFVVPARQPLTTIALTSSRYTVTVDANGEIDQCPNIRY